MKEWVRKKKFKTATTADFIRHAEEISGQDLEEFFAFHGVDPGERDVYRPPIPLGRATPDDWGSTAR